MGGPQMGDDPIRLVLMVPQSNRIVTQEGLLRTAEAAEELRFHGVSVRDHISFNGAWISSGMRDIKADRADAHTSQRGPTSSRRLNRLTPGQQGGNSGKA